MRLLSLFAATALFGHVFADCCDESSGISGECDDGTDATPCCGVGSCNIFCCNCDGGCRQGSNDGACMATANAALTACLLTAWVAEAEELCEVAWEAAKAACPSSSKKKRSTSPASPLLAARQEGGNSSGSADLFEVVDQSGDGTIGIAEYLRFVNYTTHGSLNETSRTNQWIRYFSTFDTNNDGVVSYDEHDLQ